MKIEQLEELSLLLGTISIDDTGIIFRDRQYPVSGNNKLETLTAILYNECYAKKLVFQRGNSILPYQAPQDNEFIEKLSGANYSASIENGWRVKAKLNLGQLEVIKEDKTRTIKPYEYQPYNDAVNINDHIRVRQTLEDRSTQKGFYYAFSIEPFILAPTSVRVYWNVESDGAPLLLTAITSLLNRYRLPFLFKCLDQPALYSRRDCCVLYFEMKYFHVFKWLFPSIYKTILGKIQSDVPLFTHAIAEGVGIAEHPLNNESFGMKMMKILSSAIIQIPSGEQINTERKIAYIETVFASAGVDLSSPFLNMSSKN